jgi:hypothetical protein
MTSSLRTLGLGIASALALVASLAHAQAMPVALVVQGPNVDAPIKQGAADALAGLAEVADEMDYLIAAEEAGLDPVSEQALTDLAPRQTVALVVVLEATGGGLRVTYRDGATGAVRHGIEVAPLGARLTPEQQAQIGDGAQTALSGPAPGEVAPSDGLPEPLAGDLPPPEEGVTDLPPPEEPAQPSLSAELAAGGGVGMREIDTPSNSGPRTLSAGIFPTVDLAMRVATPPRGHFYFSVSGRYQTSVFLVGHETPSGGVPRETTMRAQVGQWGLTPGYRFTNGPQSSMLGVFLGWNVRALGLVDALSIPTYTLHGPCLRPEAHFALGDSLKLRVGVELVVLMSISEDMRNLAAVSSSGLGLGAEATLTFRLFEGFAVAVNFRESHVSVPTEWGVSFNDVERFLSLQGVLQY